MINKYEQIMLGSLLGDGCIYYNYKWHRYTESHCLKQRDYLLWKNYTFNFRFYEYKNRVMICKQENKWNKKLEFYYNLFYNNGKKRVTPEILHKLKPLSLAVWFMDDGCYDYGNKAIKICSQSFNLEEHKIISEWLNKLDVPSTIKPIKSLIGTKNYALFLTSKGTRKFIEIISPYIHNSLKYKVGQDLIRIKYWDTKTKEYAKRHYNKHKYKINKQRVKYYKKIGYYRSCVYYQKNKERILKHMKEYYHKKLLQKKFGILHQTKLGDF